MRLGQVWIPVEHLHINFLGFGMPAESFQNDALATQGLQIFRTGLQGPIELRDRLVRPTGG